MKQSKSATIEYHKDEELKKLGRKAKRLIKLLEKGESNRDMNIHYYLTGKLSFESLRNPVK